MPSLLDKYSLNEPDSIVGMSLLDKYREPDTRPVNLIDKYFQPEPIPVNRTPIVTLSGRQMKEPTIHSLSDLAQKVVGEPEKQGTVENIARDAAVTIMALTPVGVAQLIEGLVKDPVSNLGGMAKSIGETYNRFFKAGVLHDPKAQLELGQVLAKRPFSELMNLAAPLGLVAGGKAIAGKFGKTAKPVISELPPSTGEIKVEPLPVETVKPPEKIVVGAVEPELKAIQKKQAAIDAGKTTDWTQRGDKLHKTEAGANAHMRAASTKYPDLEFKVVPEGKGFVLQQKAKVLPDEGQTFGTIGNPADVLAATGEKVPKFLRAMENKVESESGKKMVAQIADVEASAAQIGGTWLKPIRKALIRLSDKQAEELLRARMERVRPSDPKLAVLYDNIGAIQKEVARRYGVANPEFADRMRIREADLFQRLEYDVTHRLKPEIADQLQGDLDQLFTAAEKMAGDKPGEIALRDMLQRRLDQGNLKLSKAGEAYLKHLEKIGVDRLQGILELRNFLGERTSLYRKFGPLHERRILDLPPEFLDLNAKRVIPSYLEGAARETALAEKFGAKLQGFSDVLKAMPAKDADVVQRIMDFYTGNVKSALNPKWENRARALSGLMYFKLGPKSVVKQFAQPFFSFMSEIGFGRSTMAFAKFVTDHSKTWDNVEASGVLNVDVLHPIGGAPGGSLKVSRAAGKWMKVIGFRDANQLNQALGAIGYERHIQKLYNAANGKTLPSKILPVTKERAQYLLNKRFGIDYTKPLTDVELQKGMYRGVTESQLQKNVLKEADMMNDPTWRHLFTLQKFNLKQVKMVKDMVLDEMNASHKTGGVTAIAPLLRVLAAGALTGEGLTYFINKYNSLLSGEPRERMDKSITELYADPNFHDILIHVANNVAMAGTMGAVSDMFSGSPTFTPKAIVKSTFDGIQRLFTPVAANTAVDIMNAAKKAATSGVDVAEGKKTKGDVAAELGTDVAGAIVPDVGNVLKRTESEKAKLSRFQFQMSKLREMGYNDMAQQRIAEQLNRFSTETQADLALVEYDRTYMAARKATATGKYAEADKMVAKFFQRFPEFLDMPRKAGKTMPLTNKVIKEFLKDQKAKEEDQPSKAKRSLIDIYGAKRK